MDNQVSSPVQDWNFWFKESNRLGAALFDMEQRAKAAEEKLANHRAQLREEGEGKPTPAVPEQPGALEIVDQEKGWDGMPVRVLVGNGERTEWYFCKGHPMAAPGGNPPVPASGPSQDSQEVRALVGRELWKMACEADPENTFWDWDTPELSDRHPAREAWMKDADRILALLSQSPKGAAGAGLRDAAKKVIDAWGRWSVLDDLGPPDSWLDAMDELEAQAAAPSPTTAGDAEGVNQ